MCRMQYLLVFGALYVGMVHSWDLAASAGDGFISFYTNESLTTTISIPSRKLYALTYDEVHNMILYVDKRTNNDCICGYYLTSIENKCFTTGKGRNIHGLAFDSITERVFFTDTNDRSINWISLKPGTNNNINRIIKVYDGIPRDIVVDSCEGHVYWLNTNLKKPTIERAQLDGFKREVFETLYTISDNKTFQLEPGSLAIDQPQRRIAWLQPDSNSEYRLFTSALDKKDKSLVVRSIIPGSVRTTSNSLVVGHNTVIRMVFGKFVRAAYDSLLMNPFKKLQYVYLATDLPVSMVANYKIKDQIEGCEALSQVEISTENHGPYCVHGKKFNDKSACKCASGYIGERCDVSVCDNYCLQGNCNFNDKGLPECRCNAGFTGERCEVDVNLTMSIVVNHCGKSSTYSFPKNCGKL